MMQYNKIYQVDAFTDKPFKGNPAGVMIVDDTVATERMQRIAAEMNLSETAFILPCDDYFQIRYFTPLQEVPLCGHATLASAHILYQLGLKESTETIIFKAKGADLTISRLNDWTVMNFPRYPLTKIETPAGFKTWVGFEPLEVYASNYGWIIAVAHSVQEIKDAAPDFERIVANSLGHLMITAVNDTEEADFVVRCFAPIAGINEDPVTGSAHCALTPLWSEKLGKQEMNSLQLSKRSGRLRVKLLNKRVEIKGKAVTVFEAVLHV